MERLAVFVDLDCRFDVLRFSRLLKHKLIQANSNGKKSYVSVYYFSSSLHNDFRCYISFVLFQLFGGVVIIWQYNGDKQSTPFHSHNLVLKSEMF